MSANFYGEAEIDKIFLTDFAFPVEFIDSVGSKWCGKGIEDIGDQDLYDIDAAQMAGKVMTVLVKTGAFPGMVEGSTFSVQQLLNGRPTMVAFQVIQTRQRDDGAMTRIYLARLT